YEYKNTKKDYYYNREIYNDHINFYKKTQVEQAAIFLYLTHANYRGLYRVNKKGEFNVGYGNRLASEFLIDYSNIIVIFEFLKNKCEILCGNFIDAINSCKRAR
ncbi:MAG: DNA adenine methylase, partial [Bacilli bacterium]